MLAYSATFGGSGLNQAYGIALDSQDNVYITGYTTSTNFPTVNAFQTNRFSTDAFVTKFDTNGAIVYSTFLGGTYTDVGEGIAVDGNGDAFVTGYTFSTNFPTMNPLQSTNRGNYDAFVTEINSNGNALVYSTYLGGKGVDAANGIALDTNGDATITGFTSSTNFPTANAVQPIYGGGNGDAFVAKLSADGNTLVYSTYLGGSQMENIPYASLTPVGEGGAIAVDVGGNAYVTGWTYSTNFPVANAFQPTKSTSFYGFNSAAFVTKLDPSGNLVYSTYFGGAYGDFGLTIGVDFNDNVYFAGSDALGSLTTTNAYQPNNAGAGAASIGDGFIAALDATGTNMLYCTYLGGSGDDAINSIAVRPEDGALVAVGFTDSPDFPLLNPVQPTGNQGFFVSSSGAWNVSNSGLTQGNVVEIVVNPANPSIIYALTDTSLFKSVDGGAHWTPRSNGLGYLGIDVSTGSPGFNLLGIDPLNPDTLYLGSFGGVYKTTNGGTNWTAINTGLPSYPPSFPIVQTLAVDPVTTSNIYIGTQSSGIYKSTNGGNTWNVSTNGLTVLNVTAFLVNPQNPSILYAGCTGSSLFKSINGGASWTKLSGAPSGTIALGLDPSHPATIYAASGTEVDVSTNSGTNWQSVFQTLNFNITALTVVPGLAAPPLAIAGSGTKDVLSWPASYSGYALMFTPALNPVNWQPVAMPVVVNNGYDVVTNPMTGSQGYYRLTQTNLSAASPATVYLGTEAASLAGLYQSTDGGKDWNSIGLYSDHVLALAVNPANPATLYAGVAGGRDAFIASFTPNGQLYASTYLGGTGEDVATAVALDLDDAYVAGYTSSGDFPTAAVHNLATPAVDLNRIKSQPIKSPGYGGTVKDPTTSANAVVTKQADVLPCPAGITNPAQIWHTSQLNISTLCDLPQNLGNVDFSITGVPEGLSADSVSFFNGPIESAVTIDLDGRPTVAPGTYYIVVTIYPKYSGCSYTITTPIVVVSP